MKTLALLRTTAVAGLAACLMVATTHAGQIVTPELKQWANESIQYEPGDVKIFGGAVTYSRKVWNVGAVVAAIPRDKDQRQGASSGALLQEEHNSYGDEWIADLKGTIQLGDQTDLKAWLRYLNVASNELSHR